MMGFDVTFRFPTKKLADSFLTHMSDGNGEQDAMLSMEEHDGVKTDFDYWNANGGKFGPIVVVSVLKDDGP
jgi:hypothetical protein